MERVLHIFISYTELGILDLYISPRFSITDLSVEHCQKIKLGKKLFC